MINIKARTDRFIKILRYVEVSRSKKFKFGEFDCFTFIYEYMKIFGTIEIPDSINGKKYGSWRTKIDTRRLIPDIVDFFGETTLAVSPFDLRVGDIILIDMDKDGITESASLYLGNGKIAWVVENKALSILPIPKSLIHTIRRVL